MNKQSRITACELSKDLTPVVSVRCLNVQSAGLHFLLSLCLRSRDEALWTEFIRRTQPVIAGVIVKAIRHWTNPYPAVVDDLVQETYLKLCANDFKCLREFVCNHENALYGFLKVVASHVVHDHFRNSYSQKMAQSRGKFGPAARTSRHSLIS